MHSNTVGIDSLGTPSNKIALLCIEKSRKDGEKNLQKASN